MNYVFGQHVTIANFICWNCRHPNYEFNNEWMCTPYKKPTDAEQKAFEKERSRRTEYKKRLLREGQSCPELEN